MLSISKQEIDEVNTEALDTLIELERVSRDFYGWHDKYHPVILRMRTVLARSRENDKAMEVSDAHKN